MEDYTARLEEANNATSKILQNSLEALLKLPENSLQEGPSLQKNALVVFNPTLTSRSELRRFKFIVPSHIPSNTIPTVYRIDNSDVRKRIAVQAQMEVNARWRRRHNALRNIGRSQGGGFPRWAIGTGGLLLYTAFLISVSSRRALEIARGASRDWVEGASFTLLTVTNVLASNVVVVSSFWAWKMIA